MMIEILGTRMLAPFFGMTTYVWASLIAVALAFLAVGYWAGGLLADRKARYDIFYSLPLLCGISLIVLSLIYSAVISVCSSLDVKFGALISTLILFSIPMVLLGMVTPFAVRLNTSQVSSLGTGAGRIYAISTLGSVVGTLLVSFILIPHYAIKQILLMLSLCLLLLSTTGLLMHRKKVCAFVSLLFCFLAFIASLNQRRTTEFGELKLIHSTQSSY